MQVNGLKEVRMSMAVATAAASLVIVMVAAAVATFIAVAAIVPHMVKQILYLLGSSFPVFKHEACELQLQSSKRVVGVDCHSVGFHAYNTGHEAMLLGVHHSNDCTGVDVFMVEMVIDGEQLALHFMHTFVVILAESLFWCQSEIKFFTLFKTGNALFKSVDREAEAADKLEGTSLLGLFYEVFASVVIDRIKLIADGDELVLWFIHFISVLFVWCKVTKKYLDTAPVYHISF